MKKLLILFVICVSFNAVNAQADSLQQYTGKYKFPEGTVIAELNVTIENGSLLGSSSAGTSEFKKTEEKDVFSIVAYNGIATFSRNTEGKVIKIKLEVNDMLMEGNKDETLQYDLPINRKQITR